MAVNNWKGNNIGYFGMHRWVEYHKKKPKLCEHCKKSPPRDLSNISGKYKRDLDDYEWLCRKCHMIADGRARKYKPCLRCRRPTRNKYYCSSICSINGNSKKKDDLFLCPGCKRYLKKKEFNKGSHKYGIGTYCKKCLSERYFVTTRSVVTKRPKDLNMRTHTHTYDKSKKIHNGKS